MKTTTFENRINALVSEKRINRNTTAYKAIVAAMNNNGLIRPVECTGHGRYIKNVDHSSTITMYLNILGIKFETGNDAPRGGATGNWIQINKRQLIK